MVSSIVRKSEKFSPEYFDPLYKANLNYVCYLNESDGEQGELLKIRPMKLTYHLDDETVSLHEPHTDNSGHIQARLLSVKMSTYSRGECSIDNTFPEGTGA